MTIDAIKAITVTLEVAAQPSLFVLLAADGTINRLGSGAVRNRDRDLCIGTVNDPLFERLLEHVRPEWLTHAAELALPNRVGEDCDLTIDLVGATGEKATLRLVYGSKSEGPPGDIAQFVVKAIELTDPWHKQQKRAAKPWWRFW